LVLDSESTDSTRSICEGYKNVTVLTRAFDNHAAQWNYGLQECGITSEWVLALDADYVVSVSLGDEIRRLSPAGTVVGYRAGFDFCVLGRRLSGSLYPATICLYRRRFAAYIQQGHTQRLHLPGEICSLQHKLVHDDRKPLSRWLEAQDRYSALEAQHLFATKWRDARWASRVRLLVVVAPFLAPLHYLIARRGLFDGRAGWYYALQRSLAEILVSLRLIEGMVERSQTNDGSPRKADIGQ
jgi:glycosyltransferase involved in cell wall biosynthesis